MNHARRVLLYSGIASLILVAVSTLNDGVASEKSTPTPPGLKIFSAGHSFHVFMPRILSELATAAGIAGHEQVGVSSIGGSRSIQHWDLPADKNKAKPALETGKVQVLTLAPIYLPDEGIEKLATLAFEKNPAVRVTVQEFWLPFDVYQKDYKQRKPESVDRNARTVAEMHREHDPYFKDMEAHLTELNTKFGKPVMSVVPVGQAAIKLRAKIIAGEAPGLKQQNDLFTDAIGHATPPLQALNAYCHFAVIYGRSPVGLPLPTVLKAANKPEYEQLNRLLQELAWEAVSEHPMTGVKK
ncbi:MAG: hypothetical protein JNM18_26680 [Planctomycetaceae bacterium]|nr:hypothetical protein [Planctomycetaceae bacterium]